MFSVQNSSQIIPQLDISGLKTSDEQALPSTSSPSFGNSNKVNISVPDEHVLKKGPIYTKFSIRDYVFNSRCKDIKNSWPFSEKSLQICLKNGVKDLLPPFQTIDSMRNHYNTCFDDEEETVVVNNDSTQQVPHMFPIPSSSVIINKSKNILQPPPPVKKCRIVTRLDSNSKEFVDTMNFADHAMVSKTCPVCKTFSSSSNTTLNAHIDQCLSTESSNNKRATSDSRATSDPRATPTTAKNRIKPRKMKLMDDIYVTAKHCTLEELDRKNGTSWATKPMPLREEAIYKSHHEVEKIKHSVSKAAVQKNNSSDDGEVYIDANGTKLRILSKSDDKPVEVCTNSKILSANKKRIHHHHHMQKLENYLKLGDPQSKKSGFPKPANKLKIRKDFTARRSCEKLEKSISTQEQKKDCDFTIIRKWAFGKRTHLLRTGRKEIPSQKLAIDGYSSHKRIRNSFEKTTPSSSPESSERIEKAKQSLNQISSFHGHEVHDADSGKLNEVLDHDENSSHVKKRRAAANNGGIHSSSPPAVGSLPGTYPNSDQFCREEDQTCLSNPLVNPLCLLEDNNISEDIHDHLYNNVEEDDHEINVGVDPIPIPGPPGSFLPSPTPMDMGRTDELHGNSSLTHSRHESYDHVNRDSSNSPTSLASTISSKENFSKVKPTKTNNQSCCCARKDQNFIWKHTQKKTDYPNTISRLGQDGDHELMKFPINGESSTTSASPSSPNPVLRLMGKNLMVMNNDENSLIQHQQQQHHHQPQHQLTNAHYGGSFDDHMPYPQQAAFDMRPYNNHPIYHFVHDTPERRLHRVRPTTGISIPMAPSNNMINYHHHKMDNPNSILAYSGGILPMSTTNVSQGSIPSTSHMGRGTTTMIYYSG